MKSNNSKNKLLLLIALVFCWGFFHISPSGEVFKSSFVLFIVLSGFLRILLKGRLYFKLNPLEVPVYGLLVIVILQTSFLREFSLWTLAQDSSLFILLFILMRIPKSEFDFQQLLKPLVFAMSTVALGFILQVTVAENLFPHQIATMGGASFINRNYLMWALVSLFPISLWLAFIESNHWVFKISSGIISIAILLSQSKMAIPLMLICVIWVLLIKQRKFKLLKYFKLSLYSLIPILTIVAISLVNNFNLNKVYGFRNLIWSSLINNGEFSFLGNGYGALQTDFFSLMSLEYFRVFGLNDLITDAHSVPLQLYYEMGLGGLVLYVGFWGVAWWKIQKIKATAPSNIHIFECSFFAIMVYTLVGEFSHVVFAALIPLILCAVFFQRDNASNHKNSLGAKWALIPLLFIALGFHLYALVTSINYSNLFRNSNGGSEAELVFLESLPKRMLPLSLEYRSAEIYFNRGESSEALKRFEKIYEKASFFPMLNLSMAKIYEQRGELDKAILHFANSAERFKALIPYTQRKETELVAKLHGCQEAWEQANGKFVPENKKIAIRSYKRFCKATP